jgi:hypothetical protein
MIGLSYSCLMSGAVDDTIVVHGSSMLVEEIHFCAEKTHPKFF